MDDRRLNLALRDPTLAFIFNSGNKYIYSARVDVLKLRHEPLRASFQLLFHLKEIDILSGENFVKIGFTFHLKEKKEQTVSF